MNKTTKLFRLDYIDNTSFITAPNRGHSRENRRLTYYHNYNAFACAFDHGNLFILSYASLAVHSLKWNH